MFLLQFLLINFNFQFVRVVYNKFSGIVMIDTRLVSGYVIIYRGDEELREGRVVIMIINSQNVVKLFMELY